MSTIIGKMFPIIWVQKIGGEWEFVKSDGPHTIGEFVKAIETAKRRFKKQGWRNIRVIFIDNVPHYTGIKKKER